MATRARSAAPAWLLAALAAAAALALLTWLVQRGTTSAFDRDVLNQVAELHGGRLLQTGMETVTWAGSLFVLGPLLATILIVMVRFGRHQPARWLAFNFVGSVVTAWVMKLALERSRPVEAGFQALSLPVDFSYPSAHTAQAAALALGLLIFAIPARPAPLVLVGAPLLGIAATVTYSRLYLLVHWPTDVIAGMLIAISWASLAAGLSQIDHPRRIPS